MARKRVYQIAREFNLSSEALLEMLMSMGITVKSHMSAIDDETIVAMKIVETGDVARAAVHYTARIPSLERPAQHGIDVFLLMRADGRWRIVSIVNEIVRPGIEVPEEIRR